MTERDQRLAPSRRPLLAVAAVFVELMAAWTLLEHDAVAIAVGLHILASFLAACTVEKSAPAYRDALLVTALTVPLLGPMLAWWLLARPRHEATNAHAFFENYEAEVRGDIALEATESTSTARTMSFHEVLRHGSLDHRRNALRKLAQRGGRMHMQLLRRCLSHPDMELRLGAFTELNRLLRSWEERLTHLRDAVDQAPEDTARRAALSRAHREYAASGLLDEAMAHLQLKHAVRACDIAQPSGSPQTDLAVERAMVFAELGDFDSAMGELGGVAPADHNAAPVCVARARLAFLTRRFRDVHAEVQQLRTDAADVPPWLNELCPVTAERERELEGIAQ